MTAAREPEMALDVAEKGNVEQRVSDLVEPGVAAVLSPVRQFAAPGETDLRESLPQLAALTVYAAAMLGLASLRLARERV